MGSLSLIGFPFLTGFFSKDVILELAYTKYTISGNFAFWLGSVSVLFTSYYSFRSLFLTFLVPTNSFGRDIVRCHDAPIPMAIPLILLALGSLFVGYLDKWLLLTRHDQLGIGCGRNSRQWLRCSVDSLPLCGGPNPYE
ncbi:NADH-ubiquinone oxidoreductase chain 5 [Linum perenne]